MAATAGISSETTGGPYVDGWVTVAREWGGFSACRDPDRQLTRWEECAGLKRQLIATSSYELVLLIEQQQELEEQLTMSQVFICPACGRERGDAPVIVTVDESSVTPERCARSYGASPGCRHLNVEWTFQRPVADGARCGDCGTWWRLDLIPDDVAARLRGGNPPREDIRPSADGRTRS